MLVFFFFKQKTAYEMRISDWSSDVCSSDLLRKAQLVGIANHRNDQPLRGRYRDRDIGVIAVDDLVAFDRSVDAGHVTQRQRRRLHENAHEAQADALLLFEQILVSNAGIHEIGRGSCRERGGQYVKISEVAG